MARYLRLLGALARFSLASEMALRANFLVKITVELLWLGILLVFYRTIFASKPGMEVATWSEAQYLFFLGCYFAMQSLIEVLFLSNFDNFAELIRTGALDFVLLKPIDEQFLVSCRAMDWSSAPSFVLGVFIMITSLVQRGEWVSLPQIGLFLLTFASGLAMAYCFLLLLASTSVWLLRNQSMYEVWWLVTSLMRYPREVFSAGWPTAAWFFTFIVPIMLVANVPAGVMVRLVSDPGLIGFMVIVTVGLLLVSRRFFRFALGRYRSASS